MNRIWLSAGMVAFGAGLGCAQFEKMMATPGAEAMTRAVYSRTGVEKDALFDDGNFPAAIELLNWEVLWRPKDYDAVTSLGWMYGNIERKDLELAVYVRFKEAFPDWAEAYYPEAEFYFKARVYKPTLALLEHSLTLGNTPHPNSFRLLAHSYDRLGFYEESLRTWNRLLEIDPNDAAAKVNRDKVKAKIPEG